MHINKTLTPSLKFTSHSGKQGKVISVEKDLTQPPQWRANTEYYTWIVTARIEDKLINIKFGYDDNLKAVKYNHEPPSEWRAKL